MTTTDAAPTYTDLGYAAFDADQHYYEAPDAFIRHVPKDMRKRCMQWAEIDGKQRLLVGGKVNRFIPNPLFDPVARPGSLDDYFRGKTAGDDIRAAFGDLEPISPGYRSPATRVGQLDAQHVQACFMFPTLGVGMEESLAHDPAAVVAAFRAFNRWLHDEWAFNYQDRIFAAPYISLIDVDAAVAELEFALEHDARILVMRPGSVACPDRPRSPADPHFDPFWARVNEAGITVSYHSGDAGMQRYAAEWGITGEMEAFRYDAFRMLITGHRPIHDTIGALVAQGLFARFPNVRVATIEAGSQWVHDLYSFFKKAYAQRPTSFLGDPSEHMRGNVWISPYYEDDLPTLAELHGADRMLFGSDWPHAEGLFDPCSFIHDLQGFSDEQIRLIMRENGLGLIQRATR